LIASNQNFQPAGVAVFQAAHGLHIIHVQLQFILWARSHLIYRRIEEKVGLSTDFYLGLRGWHGLRCNPGCKSVDTEGFPLELRFKDRMTASMAETNEWTRLASSDAPRDCEELMLTYYDFVYRLANSYLLDGDEAEDVAQETFIQANLHLDRFEPGTSMKSWLVKIALNLCRSRYRRKKARQRLQEVLKVITFHLSSASPSTEDAVIQNERGRSLKAAVEALDEKHRLPVLLRYVHGLSVPEIARALDVNEGTVYSRLHYAHQKLRARLGLSEEVDP
jgi:RNA polymerase sigma-70 factor (ECF subfamily)